MNMNPIGASHFVYVIRYIEDSMIKYYIGITFNLEQRMSTHRLSYKNRGVNWVRCGLLTVEDRFSARDREYFLQWINMKYGSQALRYSFILLGGNWSD